MKLVVQHRPIEHVKPNLSEERIAKMWTAVARREHEPRLARRTRRLASLLAAACVAGLLLFGIARFRSSPEVPAPLTNLVIDSGAAGQTVTLPDGSTLDLGAATRLQVLTATASETRLRLERGKLLCDVTRRKERRFVVEAGNRKVLVRGTRFEVELEPGDEGPDVLVHVERGAVEVLDATGELRATLGAGEGWTSKPRATTVPAPSASDVMPAIPPPRAVPASAPPRETARSLFERADASLLAGRQQEAAADLEQLVQRFPNDERAGLAAHQLGRIRMRSQARPESAIEAFGFAVDHMPEGPLREDAAVGRIEAIERRGDMPSCRAKRVAFLAQYPDSSQRNRVARLCGGP